MLGGFPETEIKCRHFFEASVLNFNCNITWQGGRQGPSMAAPIRFPPRFKASDQAPSAMSSQAATCTPCCLGFTVQVAKLRLLCSLCGLGSLHPGQCILRISCNIFLAAIPARLRIRTRQMMMDPEPKTIKILSSTISRSMPLCLELLHYLAKAVPALKVSCSSHQDACHLFRQAEVSRE